MPSDSKMENLGKHLDLDFQTINFKTSFKAFILVNKYCISLNIFKVLSLPFVCTVRILIRFEKSEGMFTENVLFSF